MSLSQTTRTWARLLIVVLVILILAALALIVVAALVIVSDESTHDDSWDGLGTGLGILALILSVPTLVLSGTLLHLLRSGLANHNVPRLRGVAFSMIGVAVVGLLLAFAQRGAIGGFTGSAIVLPGLLLVIPAVGLLNALPSDQGSR